MEKSQENVKTPKRQLENDEISPNSQQENKKMPSDEVHMKNLYENQERIIAQLSKLDGIQRDVNAIKECSKKFEASLAAMDARVTVVEEELKSLKRDEKQIDDELREEMEKLKARNLSLEQSLLNSQIMIRNVPSHVKESKATLKATTERIFAAMEMDVSENDYESFATVGVNKNVATIHLKFASSIMKTRVVRKFREMRKANEGDPPFIVEKLIGLPMDHELNGKMITISNKLSQQNLATLQHARKFTPAKFEFVFDTPEGNLMVRALGKLHRIFSCDDVDSLLESVDKAKAVTAKKSKSQSSPKQTRSTKKKT